MADITAIILCGGRGTRLRPFTDAHPKALVPLRGRPLLGHLLRYLASAGISRFVVCAGYRADEIRAFLATVEDLSLQIELVDSGEEATITDRIQDAKRYVTDLGLVCYGDTLANVSLPDLVNEHISTGAIASITVYPFQCPFGIVDLDDGGEVRSFREKPVLPFWINIGYLLCGPEALALVSPGIDVPEFLERLASTKRLHAFRHTGKHLTVNTESERASAETDLISFFTVMDTWQQ